MPAPLVDIFKPSLFKLILILFITAAIVLITPLAYADHIDPGDDDKDVTPPGDCTESACDNWPPEPKNPNNLKYILLGLFLLVLYIPFLT